MEPRPLDVTLQLHDNVTIVPGTNLKEPTVEAAESLEVRQTEPEALRPFSTASMSLYISGHTAKRGLHLTVTPSRSMLIISMHICRAYIGILSNQLYLWYFDISSVLAAASALSTPAADSMYYGD
jgi:hypothetical protein